MDWDREDYKKRRKEAGLTQWQVALNGGLYQTDVSEYELGKKKPVKHTIFRLEEGLKGRK